MKTEQQLQLVTFEQAKRLRNSGFDWELCEAYNCNGRIFKTTEKINHNWFDGDYSDCSAPTVALALKWCRDEKNISGFCQEYYHGWCYEIYSIGNDRISICGNDLRIFFNTYELAESVLLDEILTILEKGK